MVEEQGLHQQQSRLMDSSDDLKRTSSGRSTNEFIIRYEDRKDCFDNPLWPQVGMPHPTILVSLCCPCALQVVLMGLAFIAVITGLVFEIILEPKLAAYLSPLTLLITLMFIVIVMSVFPAWWIKPGYAEKLEVLEDLLLTPQEEAELIAEARILL